MIIQTAFINRAREHVIVFTTPSRISTQIYDENWNHSHEYAGCENNWSQEKCIQHHKELRQPLEGVTIVAEKCTDLKQLEQGAATVGTAFTGEYLTIPINPAIENAKLHFASKLNA